MVTTNTDTYDSYRFAAPEEAFETNADTRERGATSEDAARRVRDRRASSLNRPPPRVPPKQTKKPAKHSAGKSPLSNAPIARSTPRARALHGAEGDAEKRDRQKRLSALAEATPLSDEAGAPNARSAQPGTLKKREGETRLLGGRGNERVDDAFAREEKKTKPRSALSKAPRFKSGGKNLGDALERAVEDERAVRGMPPPFGQGKRAPPESGGANGGEGPASGDRRTVCGASAEEEGAGGHLRAAAGRTSTRRGVTARRRCWRWLQLRRTRRRRRPAPP